MPTSALPDYLRTDSNWKGTDWDNPWQRWLIPLKNFFAYGPRATEKWARWREWPITLFAIRSRQGFFRIETEEWRRDSAWDCLYDERYIFFTELWAQRDLSQWMVESKQGYLSRVQKYTRWSFQIQWPFMVAFHIYFKADNVPLYGKEYDTDGKLFFFYLGAHRDADKVFWFPSAYVGLNWK